jgi:uncharacterized membrane protein (UPF0127 family)
MVKNFFILICIVILVALIYQIFFNNPSLSTANVNIKGKIYRLEIARTVPQQARGLMYRTSLCADCGMVFVSAFEYLQTFWMKNTLIPLDLIFLDRNGVVLNTLTAIPQPGVPDSQLKQYRSVSPSEFVIEINAGDVVKLSLKSGDIIDLSSLLIKPTIK